ASVARSSTRRLRARVTMSPMALSPMAVPFCRPRGCLRVLGPLQTLTLMHESPFLRRQPRHNYFPRVGCPPSASRGRLPAPDPHPVANRHATDSEVSHDTVEHALRWHGWP